MEGKRYSTAFRGIRSGSGRRTPKVQDRARRLRRRRACLAITAAMPAALPVVSRLVFRAGFALRAGFAFVLVAMVASG